MNNRNRRLDIVLALGLAAMVLVPWYRIEQGFYAFTWLSDFPGEPEASPGFLQIFLHGRVWLIAVLFAFGLALAARFTVDPMLRGKMLAIAGGFGVTFLALQGLAIGMTGFTWTISETMFGPLADGQPSMGAGAVLSAICFVLMFSFGLAERGVMRGDAFVVATIFMLVFLVAVFVFYPIGSMFIGAFQDFNGSVNFDGFSRNIVDPSIWSFDCVIGGARCGVAWRTLFLAIMTAAGSTTLGLAFALVATRTRFPFKKGLRLLTILPIITPPFVIGLALTLLFGRAGIVTQGLSSVFGIEPSRWLYGLTGIWIAQVLSFTPISFLVLIGVVEGVSPSMEEASQTLRADRWRTAMSQLDKSLDEASMTLRATSFRTARKVILPLLRPAITAALVYSFVRAITSISAVVFLVSAQYNMATSYIVGLVENGEYGVAIAYSSMLIVVMITVITGFQLLVGERRLRRENRVSGLAKPTLPVLSEEKTA